MASTNLSPLTATIVAVWLRSHKIRNRRSSILPGRDGILTQPSKWEHSKRVPEERLGLDDVLRAEHETLRPDGDLTNLSALCISGGGIRSATFALGAIQGLAERGLLEQFDYLSTVS